IRDFHVTGVQTCALPISAYGPGSRFGILHDTLGVAPAVEDVEAATHGEAISFEFILETNPDWLFVVDRDAATGEGGEAAAQVLEDRKSVVDGKRGRHV